MSSDRGDDFAARLRAARSQRGADAAPSGSGEGSSFAGQVRAFAAAGRLDRLELEPHLLRLTPDELGAYVLEAANAALAASATGDTGDAPPDPEALAAALGPAMESGTAMMRTISESLGDVMFRLRERTGMSGDPGTQGLASILDETSDLLRLAAGTTTDEPGPAPEQSAQSDDGSVVATVRPGPRVVALDIAGRALRAGAGTLAGEIVTAVNNALDGLAASAGPAAGPAMPLEGRVRDLQDASLAHMRAYTGALRALLGSVGGPEPVTRERSGDG
ncbi:hypothetical protein O7635_03295 [Asanoa sp. WMMD1127]|uniref:hypothetical protein n=1 Tax=Asanoa sp. WMMD1127 TaxID=3016107 RepID=UPI0024164D63|nr:hypothetical protein [Asanoa sp. WMMD1127]MDG4820877.1 hypothetical protein [Asanoa sp. WMMD1127]